MKKFSTLFFFLMLLITTYSQNEKIDSIIRVLSIEKNVDTKMNLYNTLCRAYINKDITKSQNYNDTLLLLSKSKDDKKMEMLAIYNNVVISKMKSDLKKAESLLNTYLNYAKTQNDSIGILLSNYQLGTIYVDYEKHEQAIAFFLEALDYARLLKKQKKIAKILNGIGVVYSQTEQYEKSKVYNLKAVKVAKDNNDLALVSIIYNGLGVTLRKQDSLNEALTYFEKSLAIAEKIGNKRIRSYQYRNIGTINLANKEYKQAEINFLKALKIRKELKAKLAIGGSQSDLADLYIKVNKLVKAETFLNKAIATFKNIGSTDNVNLMYYYLASLEAKKGNAQKALELNDKFYAKKDSVNSTILKEKINEIDIKYQTEKKDKEIARQNLQIQQQQQTQNNYMKGITFLVFIGSIFSWFLFKQRQKRKNQELITIKRETQIRSLESLIQGEEKERLRIAKELHDGVNGDLSAIKHKLNTLLELNNATIAEAVTMIDKSCEQVRAISHNLVPPALENFDLKSAIADFCTNKNNLHKPKIKFTYLGDDIKLTKIVEINIFRIVQELVNNSIKHANATKINVQFSVRGNDIQLVVEDNGKGFDTSDVKNEGIGIANIKSRISFLNAEIDINSSKEGTSIDVFMDKSKFKND